MSRRKALARAKQHWVYSIDDLMALFGAHRNTITNWRNAGLQPVDDHQPLLFKGSEVSRFHADRKLKNRHRQLPGEFKCLSCKEHVLPDIKTVTLHYQDSQTPAARAMCPECGMWITKWLNGTECERFQKCIDTKSSLQSLHEGKDDFRPEIVKVAAPEQGLVIPSNERVIHLYLKTRLDLSPKSLDQHVSAIRDLERFAAPLPFSRLRDKTIQEYRLDLIAKGDPEAAEPQSRSTLTHRAAFVRTFLDWLCKQDGYRSLPETLSDNLKLGRQHTATFHVPEPRAFATIEQAAQLVNAYPGQSLIDRRGRAIIALAYLASARVDSVSSYLFGHLDIDKRTLDQNPVQARIKNHKSQITRFFPIGEPFERVVREYVEEMRRLGLRPDDALFPPDRDLHRVATWRLPGRARIKPWKTSKSVSELFIRACQIAGLPHFSPHSVKDTLALAQDMIARTEEERKAWSFNMAHGDKNVTVRSYAKMTAARRDVAFESFEQRSGFTSEDLDEILAYHNHELHPCTPEFARAEAKAEKYKRERRARNKHWDPKRND